MESSASYGSVIYELYVLEAAADYKLCDISRKIYALLRSWEGRSEAMGKLASPV